MSVVQSIKQKLGLIEEPNQYRCEECGTEFESRTEADSRWLRCPECESEDVSTVERTA